VHSTSILRLLLTHQRVADYQKLVELLPEASSDRANTQRKLAALRPRVEEAQKKETAEMLGKLKGIGNSILGREHSYLQF